MTSIAVCVPTIPRRNGLLDRAVQSIDQQTAASLVTVTTSVAVDENGDGAAATRNRAWRDAGDVDWIAFLDDDDAFRPTHLALLLRQAEKTGADLVYPWFNIHDSADNDISSNDPLSVPQNGGRVSPYGVQWNDELHNEIMTRNNFIPITVLVRRELLADVGGMPMTNSEEWPEDCCEDWGLWRRLLNAGAKFEHLPRRTWIWYWHGKNTSGKPWKR